MRSALFIITSDPRASGRAAEAVRIAAGVQAWQQVRVRVYLDEAVARALAGQGTSLPDDALFRQCLPMLGTSSTPVLVAEASLEGMSSETWETAFAGADVKSLAALARESDWVLHF